MQNGLRKKVNSFNNLKGIYFYEPVVDEEENVREWEVEEYESQDIQEGDYTI
jgi:hypothetical protein